MPITLAQPAMHMLRQNSLYEAYTHLFEYTHLDHQSLMLTIDELRYFGATALEEIKDYSSVTRLIKAFQIAKLILSHPHTPFNVLDDFALYLSDHIDSRRFLSFEYEIRELRTLTVKHPNISPDILVRFLTDMSGPTNPDALLANPLTPLLPLGMPDFYDRLPFINVLDLAQHPNTPVGVLRAILGSNHAMNFELKFFVHLHKNFHKNQDGSDIDPKESIHILEALAIEAEKRLAEDPSDTSFLLTTIACYMLVAPESSKVMGVERIPEALISAVINRALAFPNEVGFDGLSVLSTAICESESDLLDTLILNRLLTQYKEYGRNYIEAAMNYEGPKVLLSVFGILDNKRREMYRNLSGFLEGRPRYNKIHELAENAPEL